MTETTTASAGATRTARDFFKKTNASFLDVGDLSEFHPTPFTREPDHVSSTGTLYWYTEQGVYRHSDHWGHIGNCRWEIYDMRGTDCTNLDCEQLGFAEWTCFKSRESLHATQAHQH